MENNWHDKIKKHNELIHILENMEQTEASLERAMEKVANTLYVYINEFNLEINRDNGIWLAQALYSKLFPETLTAKAIMEEDIPKSNIVSDNPDKELYLAIELLASLISTTGLASKQFCNNSDYISEYMITHKYRNKYPIL